MTLAGITYFTLADVPGRQFFRCSALRSTMSVDACAANWRRAQSLRPGQVSCVHRCIQCPIGATHAGKALVHRSLIFGADFCPRCLRIGARTIAPRGAARCTSCHSRELEFRKQRDGRGNVPHFRLAPRRLAVIVDFGADEQRTVEIVQPYTRDLVELAIQTLRLASGRIAFTRSTGRRPAVSVAKMAMDVFGVKAKSAPPVQRRRSRGAVSYKTKAPRAGMPPRPPGTRARWL
jgi:hypothetical protein